MYYRSSLLFLLLCRTVHKTKLHPLEKDKKLLRNFREELPLDLLITYDKRSDRDKYNKFLELDHNSYPCIQILDHIDTDFATSDPYQQKLFCQRLRKHIKKSIKEKMKSPTPTTPQPPTTPQLNMSLLTSGVMTTEQFLKFYKVHTERRKLDTQSYVQSEKTRQVELKESTKKEGISSNKKISKKAINSVSKTLHNSSGSSDFSDSSWDKEEEDAENSNKNSNKNSKRKRDSRVKKNLFQDHIDKKLAAKPTQEPPKSSAPNKRRGTTVKKNLLQDHSDKKPAAKPTPEPAKSSTPNKRPRTTTSTGFAAPAFGAAPAPAFGGGSTSTSPAPSVGGLFGSSPAAAPAFGAAPAPAAFGTAPAPSAGGLFGAASAPAAASAFGAAPAAVPAFEAAPALSAGGLFGAASALAAAPAFRAPAFGAAPAAAPAFGAAPAPAAFGAGSTSAAPAAFGAAPAPSAGGLFGAASAFGPAATGSDKNDPMELS